MRKNLHNSHRAAEPPERQRATVLVVADDFAAHCVRRVLEGALFRIVAVASVEEAIACNERLGASLVILTLAGDQRRDHESALRLRLACTSHRPAMIAIGASSDSRAVQAALEYADDYVSATVLKAELPGRARAALRRREENRWSAQGRLLAPVSVPANAIDDELPRGDERYECGHWDAPNLQPENSGR